MRFEKTVYGSTKRFSYLRCTGKLPQYEMVSERIQFLTWPKILVKMTLRSAVRPRRALTRHSAGIFVSLHTLSFHLWFTLSTLPVHLVISYSHTFHLSVTWPARCPVTDSQRTGQGLEASFHKTLNSLLDFKSAPQMLYLCKSHTFHFNAIPYP